MKRPFCLLIFLSLLLFAALVVQAQPPAAVVEKLKAPTPGIEPLVLYLDSADTNMGTGEPRWVATSGTRLSARGTDAWGNEGGAFGPPDGAVTGAAIASSIESPLLAGDSGALVLCVQVPEVTGDPAMVISRGAWGDHQAFDLRVDRNKSLILYCGGKGAPPEGLQLGRMVPGAWMLVGLTWKKQGDEITLETLLGELASGQASKAASFTIPRAGGEGSPVLIAGRTNRELSPALLEGGLFCALAIYGESLSLQSLEEIFGAMASASQP